MFLARQLSSSGSGHRLAKRAEEELSGSRNHFAVCSFRISPQGPERWVSSFPLAAERKNGAAQHLNGVCAHRLNFKLGSRPPRVVLNNVIGDPSVGRWRCSVRSRGRRSCAAHARAVCCAPGDRPDASGAHERAKHRKVVPRFRRFRCLIQKRSKKHLELLAIVRPKFAKQWPMSCKANKNSNCIALEISA
jgi:hypothetical protein